MRLLLSLLCFLMDEYLLMLRRLNCARHGHVLIPMTDASVCKLCGLWIGD